MAIDYGVWAVRLLLAAVFGLSASGKFADLPGTRKSVGEFGVPIRLVPTVAWALPVAEAATAAGLLIPWAAIAAAALGLSLLLVFTVAVIRLLRAGKHPACSCFGAAGTAPIGWATILRNAALIAVAALALAGAVVRPRVPLGLPADHVLISAVAAVFAVTLIRLGGELRALRRRLDAQALSTLGAEGLPVGAVAPEFDLRSTAGGRTGLHDLLTGRNLLLVFVHPACEMCAALARELPRWQARTTNSLTIVVVGNGELDEHAAWARQQALGEIPVLVQQGNEAALRYRVRGTPSGVLIGPDARVAAPVARGAMAIRDLIFQAKRTAGQRSAETNGAVL
ncbi:MauE/DoxX family redox-associated membrane protein [Nocardia inohanensis]|uniref:MauE/DoxX family redox-associated membrane protein n=1 Tax=Nocardia inohanensis TaxID=209246 RepID=UPI000834A60E|nr:MauE/DoxX family redox-associated membrane protein [Nocardia inohanensis]